MKKSHLKTFVLLAICFVTASACTSIPWSKEKVPEEKAPEPTLAAAETTGTTVSEETPVPTDTPIPTDTSTPTVTPTITPLPTRIPTPTHTPRPTNTPTPLPTPSLVGSERAGYITTARSYFETENLLFDIDKDIYVAPHFSEKAQKLYEAVKKATGTSDLTPAYDSGKIWARVNRNFVSQTNNNPKTEYGRVSNAYKENALDMGPAQLFVDNSNQLIEAFAGTIFENYTGDYHSFFFRTGYEYYTAFKVLATLNDEDPYLAATGDFENLKLNSTIKFEELIQQTPEYWIGHEKEAWNIGSNGNLGIGLRFMAYLDNVYGTYSAWLLPLDGLFCEYLEDHPGLALYNLADEDANTLAIKCMKMVYGESVFDNFYDWIRDNEKYYIYDIKNSGIDLSNIHECTVYPQYYWRSNPTRISYSTKYDNLLVDLAPTIFYLKKYKGEDTSNLVLNLSERCEVELYDEYGILLQKVTGPTVPLTGVSAVKLLGTGVTKFEITGYDIYEN